MSFDTFAGEALAMGERTPLALLDAPASGRMAVGEALTNMAAAPMSAACRRQALGQLDGRRRPPGEDQALFEAVKAVAWSFCPALGMAIPVGKDSLSMRTRWSEAGERSR
jgi:phosphoribosylformylglycinamidine synthase